MTLSLRTFAFTALTISAFVLPEPASNCAPRHRGAGPVPTPDTAEAFQSLRAISDAATLAKKPGGYVELYKDQLVTLNDPAFYTGHQELQSYDVAACAFLCDKNSNCNAFNIFFEREPSLEPGPGCPNPPSTTTIKCSLWTGTIQSETSFSHGQYKGNFHVVMAGSNAYVKTSKAISPPIYPGYIIDKHAYSGAIQAPLDCHNASTYLGVRTWNDGQFDIQRCLDMCTRWPGCHFVNTYLQLRNNVPYSQHCAMYTVHWPAKYATNQGSSGDKENIHTSYTNSFGLTSTNGNFEACEPQPSGVMA